MKLSFSTRRSFDPLAPSLLVSSSGTESNGAARIRGIGTVGDNPGLESSVAVFIDGVYRSRTGVGLNELGEIRSEEHTSELQTLMRTSYAVFSSKQKNRETYHNTNGISRT